MADELNTRVMMRVRRSEIVPVPVDDTLSIAGQAADAKATGDALDLKADKSQISTISVNGQQADNQGKIMVSGTDIPVSEEDDTTLEEAVGEALGRTAEDIPMSSDPGASSIATVVNSTINRNADQILLSTGSTTTVTQAITTLQEGETLQGGRITALEGKTGASIPYEPESADSIKDKIVALEDGRVVSVNGVTADNEGDITLETVPLSVDLSSDRNTSVTGTFIARTTAGAASIANGAAKLEKILGHNNHEGFVAEVLDMEVIPMFREDADPIEATIDRAAFIAEVSADADITLVYTTEWSESPASYGITVTGVPIAGDQIRVHYIKEERGTITQAFDTEGDKAFIATGWNLYDHDNGWARVAVYNYKYKIGGAYNTIRFKDDPSMETSYAVAVDANGLFTVPRDGYIILTGGNDEDTYITTAWTDWTDGYIGAFQTYTETEIDLSSILANMPYGLCSAGSVCDEIDFSAGTITQRIGRVAYSDQARQEAEESGRAYEFDEDWIYFELAPADIQTSTFVQDPTFTADSHGIEYFTNTNAGATLTASYKESLKDKLQRDVVTISQQTLESNQQAQIRQNIGAVSNAEMAAALATLNGSILIRKYTYKISSFSANSSKSITAENFGITQIDGYKLAMLILYTTGYSLFSCSSIIPAVTGSVMALRNLHSSAVSNKTCGVLGVWIKNQLIGE